MTQINNALIKTHELLAELRRIEKTLQSNRLPDRTKIEEAQMRANRLWGTLYNFTETVNDK